MKEEFKSALTNGLNAGYAGGKPESINRGSFSGKASHIELPEGVTYHDEWFASSSGGGQELVRVGDEIFTRLYAGGTTSEEVLSQLGITDKDVGSYLKRKIIELGEKTRLMENCEPGADGDWQYKYLLTGNYPETNVTTSLESITYRETPVHHHAFILCPVK